MAWATTVERAERNALTLGSGCPCCDGSDGLEARDALEGIVRRGGKRGRRIATLVRDLDDRFERATLPAPEVPSEGRWWRGRLSR
jgi:hypothetical protein